MKTTFDKQLKNSTFLRNSQPWLSKIYKKYLPLLNSYVNMLNLDLRFSQLHTVYEGRIVKKLAAKFLPILNIDNIKYD